MIAHLTKVFATMPDELNSISRTYRVEGELSLLLTIVTILTIVITVVITRCSLTSTHEL